MSAAQKIPESLVDDVVARSSKGWSLRRIATWLTKEKDIPVTRSAVTGCLERAMQPEPDIIVNARRELADEVPTNIDELKQIQQEIIEVTRQFRNKEIPVAEFNSSLRSLAQRSRLAIWMLRAVGIGPVAVRPLVQGEQKPDETPDLPPPALFLPEEVDELPPADAPPKIEPEDPRRDEPCPCGSFKLFRACHALLNAYQSGRIVTIADMDDGVGSFRNDWMRKTPQHPQKDLTCPCGRPRLYLSCHGVMNVRVEESDDGRHHVIPRGAASPIGVAMARHSAVGPHAAITADPPL